VVEGPANVEVYLTLPRVRGRTRRLSHGPFEIFDPLIRLTLADGEVGQLTIPVHVLPEVPPKEYTFSVQVEATAGREGMRRRPNKGEDMLGDLLLSDLQGLGITLLCSRGFETRKRKEQAVPLVVTEAEEVPEPADIKPNFESLWIPKDWDAIVDARRELNDRRIHIVPALTPEAVYLPFMRESQALFSNSNVQLHLGEAIFVAKILTFTVSYFMRNAEWQDCLLVPIYAYAQSSGQAIDDPVWSVTRLGYLHVLELAIALSFSLVEEALKRQSWDPVEQRVLRDYIVGRLDSGASLPAEFLYLPLILGGIAVAGEVALGDEGVQESLRMLAKAKAAKAELFADQDLQVLNDTFDRLVAKQALGRAVV
jgi:hypothetical protein